MTAIFDAIDRRHGCSDILCQLPGNKVVFTDKHMALTERTEARREVEVSQRVADGAIHRNVKRKVSGTDFTARRNIIGEEPVDLRLGEKTGVFAQNFCQKVSRHLRKQRSTHGFKCLTRDRQRIEKEPANFEASICVKTREGNKPTPRVGDDCDSIFNCEISHDCEGMVPNGCKGHIFDGTNRTTGTKLIKIYQPVFAGQKIEVRPQVGVRKTWTSVQHDERRPGPDHMDRSRVENSAKGRMLVSHPLSISNSYFLSIEFTACSGYRSNKSKVARVYP